MPHCPGWVFTRRECEDVIFEIFCFRAPVRPLVAHCQCEAHESEAARGHEDDEDLADFGRHEAEPESGIDRG